MGEIRKLYELDLNGMVDVVETKGPLTELFIVRQIPRDDSDRKVKLLNQVPQGRP